MSRASIPVDLFNPGQVFACLGFLEAAEILLGDAEGAFDWSDGRQTRFLLATRKNDNPFFVILEFLANADLTAIAPNIFLNTASTDNSDSGLSIYKSAHRPDSEKATPTVTISDTFPAAVADKMALPLRLESPTGKPINISHWADTSSRSSFKLYSGNRTAYSIAKSMLFGKRSKPIKTHPNGKLLTLGLRDLWKKDPHGLVNRPFDVLTPMGGSFNFDPRGGWTPIDAGFSPDLQKKINNVHGIAASPVVEILAPIGLENSRPKEYSTREVGYYVWADMLPPLLARPALSGAKISPLNRGFRFGLRLSGKNKVVTHAQEEI